MTLKNAALLSTAEITQEAAEARTLASTLSETQAISDLQAYAAALEVEDTNSISELPAAHALKKSAQKKP